MILLTGATGLVGSHLAFNLIHSGQKVRAIKRSCSNPNITKRIFNYYSKEADQLFNQIEWVEGDITDICSLQDAMQGIEKIYHCAALVSFQAGDKELLTKINVEGTANVVNAALEGNIQKLCYVSSVAALGKAKQNEPIDETTEWKDSAENSAYAISKYRAEREVMRGIAEGLQAVIVNPSIIIGPGEWDKSSATLFRTVWKGLKYYSQGVNAYVDVRDVVNIMIELMESSTSNERFIVCAEHSSYQAFFDLVATYLQKPKPYIHATPLLGELAWRMEKMKSILTGTTPFITKETARTANQKVNYQNDKIKKALKYSFISIEQSIKDTAQHFLKDHSNLINL